MISKFFVFVCFFGLVGCQSVEAEGLNDGAAQGNADSAEQSIFDGYDAPNINHKYKYEVRGKQYKVFETKDNFQQIGVASWYGPGFHGKKTASGEIYNMNAMTAAHKTLPLGTHVQVTNLETGKKVIVRVNDRGPFHGGRVIDVSKKAAQQLGMLKKGSIKVHIKIVDQ